PPTPTAPDRADPRPRTARPSRRHQPRPATMVPRPPSPPMPTPRPPSPIRPGTRRPPPTIPPSRPTATPPRPPRKTPPPPMAMAPGANMREQHPTASRKLTLKRRDDQAAETPRREERLHKVLPQAGLGSRRALEQRIADGLVKVNGEVAQVGMSVKGGDRIEIDGRQFVASALTEPARVLMYNKPEGEVTTREDPEGRP